MESKKEITTVDKLSMALDDVIQTNSKRPRADRRERGRDDDNDRDGSSDRDMGQEIKSTRIFVGNLNYTTSWRYLKDYMRKAGDVIHVDIFADAKGNSKGCALVEFASEKDARNAMKQLNKTMLDGREIFLREDDQSQAKYEKEQGKEKGGGKQYNHNGDRRRYSRSRSLEKKGGYSRGYDRDKPRYREDFRRNSRDLRRDSRDSRDKEGYDPRTDGWQIIVKNLPWDVTWQELKDAFREYGEVIRADIATERSGRPAGYGFVIFKYEKDADAAITSMDGANFGGRDITVKFASGK